MSYATSDFTESLERVQITGTAIDRVLAAWGKGDGMGDDAGHYKWAEDGATDWNGGFLLRMKDGRYLYLTGWCDYTGWGCQDGAEVHEFDHEPTHAEMEAASDYHAEPAWEEWDIEPADLNRWIVAQRSQTP